MKLKYKVILKSPALTGQSGVIGKDTDVLTKVDSENLPYFPASHIKGIFKNFVEKMSETLNEYKELKSHFGIEGNDVTKLRFSDLKLKKFLDKDIKDLKEKIKVEKVSNLILNSRHGIRVDRETRTTEENSLFSYEFISKDTEFEGEIEFSNEISSEELKFLIACFSRVDKIGGLKSRGLGNIEIKFDNKNLNEIVSKLEKEKKSKKIINELSYNKKYNFNLEISENLILKEKEIGNEIMTKNYIQGSTIRGALIKYLFDNFDLSEKLKDKFITNIKTSQAIPEGYFISPASLIETKYPVNGSEKEKSNRLFTSETEYEKDNKKVKFERYSSKFLKEKDEKNKKYEVFKIEKQNDIGITIDRDTLTSEDGKIFNKEILMINKNNNKFTGEIEIPENLYNELKEIEILIGKQKNKGFGKTKFNLTEKIKENIDIQKNIENLHNEVKQNLKEDDKIELEENQKFFTIDCISDIVLPFNEIYNVGTQLKDLLNLNIEFIEAKSVLNIDKMQGFNYINQIRKSDELIITKGSVLAFKGNIDENIETLEEIRTKGIGLRKNEGFGNIEISSDIHLKFKVGE